jgi:hypothetical protein
VRHPHASLTPGGLATLQRRLGNRGMGALIQRLTVPTTQPEAGENTATAAQEQAELHAAAQHRADARRLLPAELEEVSAMVALAPPQGPGIVLGPGTKKLLDAVGRLGSRVAGPPASYVRDPATEHGPPSFVLGKLEDPEGRITVTADGLLEVTHTRRTPVKGNTGEFKVSHDTATLDLQGKKLTLPKKGSATDSFLAEAQKAVEAEKQSQVLGALRGSETKVRSGDPDAEPMTLGAFVSEATAGDYIQRAYLGKDNKPTELLKKVTAAFDQLRKEFDASKPPPVPEAAAAGPAPTQEALAKAFAAKLQPTLFMTAATAQSELDQRTAEQTSAQAEADSTKAALAALKGRAKTVAKADKAAYDKDVTAAQVKAAEAAKRLSAANRAVAQQKPIVAGLLDQRDKFVTTITWILDPSASSEQRAAPTVGALCNVLSYFLYAKAIGLIPADTDFKDYYLAEVKAGNIRWFKGQEHASGVYWGEGSWKWERQRRLVKLDDPHPRAQTKTAAEVPAKPIGDPSRSDQLRQFLASDANIALSHQDLANTPPKGPHHFLPIVRGDDGVWRNMDHTSSAFTRRGGITDWGRVFQLEVDADLYKKARSAKP